jgi:tetratricopeptide (TPR) repeat protein
MFNLDRAYQSTEDSYRALPLFEETLRLMKAKLGAEHPTTLTIMNNLAHAYKDAGDLDRALPLFVDTLRLMNAKLGADHPHTLASTANLAGAYQTAGDLDRALLLFERAAAGMENRRFQHESAEWIVSDTIDCYEQLKKFSQAEGWRRKWLAVVRERAGAESLDYAGELAALGLNLLSQKKYGDAELVLRDCVAIREKKAADDWTTFNTRSMLGEALVGLKRFGEAERLLVAGYEGIRARREKIPKEIRGIRESEAAERLVALYDAWQKPDEAARWRARIAVLRTAAEPRPPEPD